MLRWTYKEFFDRYRMLLPWRRVRPNDVYRMCETILTNVIKVRVCWSLLPGNLICHMRVVTSITLVLFYFNSVVRLCIK